MSRLRRSSVRLHGNLATRVSTVDELDRILLVVCTKGERERRSHGWRYGALKLFTVSAQRSPVYLIVASSDDQAGIHKRACEPGFIALRPAEPCRIKYE